MNLAGTASPRSVRWTGHARAAAVYASCRPGQHGGPIVAETGPDRSRCSPGVAADEVVVVRPLSRRRAPARFWCGRRAHRAPSRGCGYVNRASAAPGRLGRTCYRRLVWAGIRGDDAEPLADLPQFEASYTIINAYSKRLSVEGKAYEDLTGTRVDLETWDIDDHLDASATATFRRLMLQALAAPSALLPYRPSSFLSAIWFARRDRCRHLGCSAATRLRLSTNPGWRRRSPTSASDHPVDLCRRRRAAADRGMLRRGP